MPARLPQSLTKTLAFLRQQPLALLPQLESTGWKARANISVRVPGGYYSLPETLQQFLK